MSIISIQRIEVGQVGIKPGRVKILSTDNLATVTAAGYLNGANLQGITIGPLDVIEMMYGYNASSGTATWSDFTVAVSGGIITLSAAVSPGDVLLPVVSGDFPIFNGTSGQIKDSGMSATDATKTKLVALNAAPTINHVAIFTNANGTIGDGGVLGTAAAKAASASGDATVASVSGATVTGNFLKAADTAGTVADGGAAIHAGVTATFAGGGVTNTFTTTNMLATSIVTAVILTSANAVAIAKAVPGTNQLAVTFTADPGAGTTLNWISITPAI